MPFDKSYTKDVLQNNKISDEEDEKKSTIPNRDLMRNHYTKNCDSLKRTLVNVERKANIISYLQDKSCNVQTKDKKADAIPFASNKEHNLPELLNQSELEESSTNESHKRKNSRSDSIEYRMRKEFHSRIESLDYNAVYNSNYTYEPDLFDDTTTANQLAASTNEASTQSKEVPKSSFSATPIPELNLDTPADRRFSDEMQRNETASIEATPMYADSYKTPFSEFVYNPHQPEEDSKYSPTKSMQSEDTGTRKSPSLNPSESEASNEHAKPLSTEAKPSSSEDWPGDINNFKIPENSKSFMQIRSDMAQHWSTAIHSTASTNPMTLKYYEQIYRGLFEVIKQGHTSKEFEYMQRSAEPQWRATDSAVPENIKKDPINIIKYIETLMKDPPTRLSTRTQMQLSLYASTLQNIREGRH